MMAKCQLACLLQIRHFQASILPFRENRRGRPARRKPTLSADPVRNKINILLAEIIFLRAWGKWYALPYVMMVLSRMTNLMNFSWMVFLSSNLFSSPPASAAGKLSRGINQHSITKLYNSYPLGIKPFLFQT